jgi:hypothetical protein
MATIGQIADAIRQYPRSLRECTDPVVVEVSAADVKAPDTETVFVTSRLSMAPWPSAKVVLDLSEGETLDAVIDAGGCVGEELEDLLRCWNVGAI